MLLVSSIPVRQENLYLIRLKAKQLMGERAIQTGSSSPKGDCSFGNTDDSYVSSPAGYSLNQDLFNGLLVHVFP